ncbi:hypothetical protein M409DRAFT_16340 [Zasmidium cellare ATCC 36951]|uniref:Uncharacterized protein n=1 Tax=Zasmidium cellare ATCC 36951 TaxID=1080233 RepID=A0A6A6D8U0_ZASCE|nr:uncharacterized protein M409DRAFT_16340 [Zasmidium cellare ATCC 36951]KAF2174066.1 hypothetical protein M409DRAFT_16340 [Zasmidium cellare ATCC 36951]
MEMKVLIQLLLALGATFSVAQASACGQEYINQSQCQSPCSAAGGIWKNTHNTEGIWYCSC